MRNEEDYGISTGYSNPYRQLIPCLSGVNELRGGVISSIETVFNILSVLQTGIVTIQLLSN